MVQYATIPCRSSLSLSPSSGRVWQSTNRESSEDQNRPVDQQGEKSGKVPWQSGQFILPIIKKETNN